MQRTAAVGLWGLASSGFWVRGVGISHRHVRTSVNKLAGFRHVQPHFATCIHAEAASNQSAKALPPWSHVEFVHVLFTGCSRDGNCDLEHMLTICKQTRLNGHQYHHELCYKYHRHGFVPPSPPPLLPPAHSSPPSIAPRLHSPVPISITGAAASRITIATTTYCYDQFHNHNTHCNLLLKWSIQVYRMASWFVSCTSRSHGFGWL